MGPADVEVLRLPVEWFVLAAFGLVSAWIGCILLVRFSSSRKTANGMQQDERDPSIPAIDSQAGRDSPFHRWDARIKLASLLFFMFCAASLTQLFWATLVLALSIASICVARIPFRYPLRRLAAMGAFLGMFLVVMPITAPARSGDTLVVFEHLSFVSFNLRGFPPAVLICLKASAIALLVEPLLATSPFPVTVKALAGLGTPLMVCQMVLLAHRYIFVFQDEATRMVRAMRARGFRKRTDFQTIHTVANFLGMLLVRSFERTQRVYEAMLARGYNGSMPGAVEFSARKRDWVKGAFWVSAGVAMVIADRFWKVAMSHIF